ncbi:MAG: hypothetical protein JWO22_1326 [Frankiales bacterium]|nr:hypothetical protein [Frankiales bacterium]
MRGARHGHRLTDGLLVLLIAAGATAQGISGIGFGLICGPVLVSTLGRTDGVRVSVFFSALINLGALAREHAHVAWRSAIGLLLPAVIATPLLALALDQVPSRAAQVIAGLAALVGASALAAGLHWPAAHSRRGMVGAAVVSAGMNDAAGIGGPAVALWADNAGWSHEKTRGTLQVYFLALNTVAMVTLGVPQQSSGRYGEMLAALVGGYLLGGALSRRTPPALARRVTLALAGAGGVVVLVRALIA